LSRSKFGEEKEALLAKINKINKLNRLRDMTYNHPHPISQKQLDLFASLFDRRSLRTLSLLSAYTATKDLKFEKINRIVKKRREKGERKMLFLK